MTPLAAGKAVCLVAANAVALVTSGVALTAVIAGGGTGFAAAGIGLTLLLLLLAAIRGERPVSGYLSAITSLALFFVVSYFAFG